MSYVTRALRTISETTEKYKRWTPLMFLDPDEFVAPGLWWQTFDIHSWSRNEYEYTTDGWTGYKDFAKDPRRTVHENRGDCEDFALVAASWALSNGRGPVKIGFCWEKWKPHPTHVVCHDGELLFSSGRILPSGRAEYRDRSSYDYIIWRSVGTQT